MNKLTWFILLRENILFISSVCMTVGFEILNEPSSISTPFI